MQFPVEIDGEIRDGQSLKIIGYPNSNELKFRIVLVFEQAVFRLDFADEWHTNNGVAHLAAAIPEFVQGPHYHPWQFNRELVKDRNFKLPVALPLNNRIRQFDAALRWLCAETNTEIRDHSIELPEREDLF